MGLDNSVIIQAALWVQKTNKTSTRETKRSFRANISEIIPQNRRWSSGSQDGEWGLETGHI